MSAEEPLNQNEHKSSTAALAVLGLCCILLGWLVGFSWANRATIGQLWLQASEQKYLTMTGEAGPVTYLVTHNDYQALEMVALSHDDVLGIEVYAYPDKAAIAFNAAESSSIQAINQLPMVLSMRQKIIPMMCH